MIWAAFAKLLTDVLALVASWFVGRNAGKTDAKIEELQDAVEGHVLRNEVENRIAREHDARKRLRDSWSE